MKQLKTANNSMSKVCIDHSIHGYSDTNMFLVNKVLNRLKNTDKGQIEIILPNKQSVKHCGDKDGQNVHVHFKTWKSIVQYIILGELSFVDAYINGDVDIRQLSSLFNWYIDNEKKLPQKKKNNLFIDLINRFSHLVLNNNNRAGSKKNISFHYDMGNEFYKKWLDNTMTYSAGIFCDKANLEQSQHNKYNRIIKVAELNNDDNVLEIGCGWGGFAEHALSLKNINYRGITISEEQLKFTNERLLRFAEDKELAFFEDYRDTEGSYDKIVSIEMFEAVGEKHWGCYFDTIKNRLKKNGKAIIQVITIEHERYLKYRNKVDFIQKYIFPGGMLPSKEVFKQYAHKAGMKITDEFAFGQDYAETLRHWKRNFLLNWEDIREQGFDERFYRMWLYYLDYCITAFERNTIDVVHFSLTHD